jgi:hypothetical protein
MSMTCSMMDETLSEDEFLYCETQALLFPFPHMSTAQSSEDNIDLIEELTGEACC